MRRAGSAVLVMAGIAAAAGVSLSLYLTILGCVLLV